MRETVNREKTEEKEAAGKAHRKKERTKGPGGPRHEMPNIKILVKTTTNGG